MSRNQKVLAAVVAVLVVVACLAAVWVFVLHGGDAIRWRSDFHIDRLEELSELVTLRVQVSDVLCAEAAGAKENIGRARSNAEKTLRLLFKRLGWDVEIAWQGAQGVARR